MKKLPVAGPTYDYKLENIRNDIIEQELALCLKRQEDLAQNATIVDGDGNTTTLRANLDTEFYTRTEADAAIASATTTLVSTSDLTTALGDYTTTASLELNYYTKTSTDSAISSATTNLVSTSDLTTALGDYTTTATLTANYYTETEADTAISDAITTNNVTIGETYATIDTVSSVSGDVDSIEGKYAVKIDNNGHVSGFGLISTANDATIAGDGISGSPLPTTSTFTIAADAFKIVDTSDSNTPKTPFSVYNSSRVVDGITLPAGVYMENAFITKAEIVTLDADVIDAGTLNAERINIDGTMLDVTALGELKIKDAGVDTTQLETNSVTKLAAQRTASLSQTFGTSMTNVRDLTFTETLVYDVYSWLSVDVKNVSGSSVDVIFELHDTSDTILAQTVRTLANNEEQNVSLAGFSATINGSNSFAFAAQVVGGGDLEFDYLSLQILGRKR